MALNPMIDPIDLQKKALRKWPLILRSAILLENLFPMELPLGPPQGLELLNEFESVGTWIREIRAFALKHDLGLRDKVIQHRQMGAQVLPTHLLINDLDHYLKWIGRGTLFRRWLAEVEITLRDFPALHEWLLKNVETVERNLDIWPSIRAVMNRFMESEIAHLYLRELDIPWVDTKFIETNRMLLSQLLIIVLPEERVIAGVAPSSASRFCQKFGLRFDQTLIRFRWLDEDQAPAGLADMTIPLNDFQMHKPEVENVFITENKINGLIFPRVKNSIVIFGLGGGIDILREVNWLQSKRVLYWGDIDRHGFAILARLRKFLPNAESFLMDSTTFHSFKIFWVKDSASQRPDCNRELMSPEEIALFDEIYDEADGGFLRLEQERIPVPYIRSVLGASFEFCE
ncbi:MAG: hypothetical protein H7318_10800 [Oligoflexus sp.]|nr:hypothetical protein [Oligoflexus sp.]